MSDPSRDVCQRRTCGWYRYQHTDNGDGPRCPYHYRKKHGSFSTFVEGVPTT